MQDRCTATDNRGKCKELAPENIAEPHRYCCMLWAQLQPGNSRRHQSPAMHCRLTPPCEISMNFLLYT
ncbi:hypothetical protein E2C01_006690 [Portunus trituberculatus]|uniref:Uncharacterized protein n=1 Tax=Portunus trituberculatus TaxID=210409 RepID=A0A5B7CX06_PORTR|nr:hypothetical protein [Portunus trituberculatus]